MDQETDETISLLDILEEGETFSFQVRKDGIESKIEGKGADVMLLIAIGIRDIAKSYGTTTKQIMNQLQRAVDLINCAKEYVGQEEESC